MIDAKSRPAGDPPSPLLMYHIPEVSKMNQMWKNGILGVIVGDALGCPVQFESRSIVATHPVTGMRGYGTFNLPPGSWTDDSSLTLALLESIKRTGGIDLNDIMSNFVTWLDDGAFTPYGYAYDIGGATMSAIQRYKRNHDPMKCGGRHERDNGNGSLMRIMPAVLYCCDQELPPAEAVDIIHKVGSLTHAHIRANTACGLYYFMAAAILKGEGSLIDRLQAGLDEGFAFYETYMDGLDLPFEDYLEEKKNLNCYDRLRVLYTFADLPSDAIRGTGYVVDALEAAVWSLVTTADFESALLKAVNLGDDTDTVAAIAGGLAGLYYQSIPSDWIAALQRREWIEGLIELP